MKSFVLFRRVAASFNKAFNADCHPLEARARAVYQAAPADGPYERQRSTGRG